MGLWIRTVGAAAVVITTIAVGIGCSARAPKIEGLDGDWSGMLGLYAAPERIVVHVRTDPLGTHAELESPDKNMSWPIAGIRLEGSNVALRLTGGGDEVIIDGARTAPDLILGDYHHAGRVQPLVLHRVSADSQAPAVQHSPAPSFGEPIPGDDDLRRMLAARIDQQRQGVGAVVGVVEPTGTRIVAYGRRRVGSPDPVRVDTVFAVDSITKVFTSLLLADMARRGEVGLDDPVARKLETAPTARSGQALITLRELAEHRSGLPLFADTPAAGVSPAAAERALETEFAARPSEASPGRRWTYSNFGYDVLARALARTARKPLAVLISERITGPLGMGSTGFGAPPPEGAVGHDAALRPVAPIELSLPGASGLHSNAPDLLKLLSAELGFTSSPLTAAMKLQTADRTPTNDPAMRQALGWEVTRTPLGEVFGKSGGSTGYHSYIGFNPTRRLGVVVLTNAATVTGPEEIGLRVLVGSPLRSAATPVVAPKVRRANSFAAIAASPATLVAYAGTYQLTPGSQLYLTVRDGRLFGRINASATVELFAADDQTVFSKDVDAWVSFDRDRGGSARQGVLHLNGVEIPLHPLAHPGA